jgi:hypothetical protein
MAKKDPLIKRSAGNPYSKRNNNFYKKPSQMDNRIYVPYRKHYKPIFRKTRYSSTSDGDGCLGCLGLIAILFMLKILSKMIINFEW